MANVSILKFISITLYRGHINIIHCVAFKNITIITIVVGITNHRLDFTLLTVVVALEVALKCAFVHIAIDKYRLHIVCRLWNLDNNNTYLLVILYDLHILILEYARINLIAIYRIPKILDYVLRGVNA